MQNCFQFWVGGGQRQIEMRSTTQAVKTKS